MLDSQWEAELCRVVEAHPRVSAYTKNHNLGFEVPYRYGSEVRRYRPDFIVLVDDGHGPDDLLHLVVETKGYRREDAKDKKLTMDTYWVPGVNNLETFGRWAFAELDRCVSDGERLRSQGRAGVQSRTDRRIGAGRREGGLTWRSATSLKPPKAAKNVEALRHTDDKRLNIPTAEHQSVLEAEHVARKEIRYPRNTDLDPQLVWRGKDYQDWSDLVVQAPPLYIQEKVHPKVLIDDLLRESKDAKAQESGAQIDLFADFNGVAEGADRTDFYQHDQNWTNRMILGDSLQVMASLAEREGLRGKVQCIYIDPPYGIKFNSNFQWSTTSRDVKDGNAGHITREPEQVKAFRDTWRDGIHSYLTYLRDRLTVARDLLTESGSIFVQIGDENVHRVRALMDEVFGDDNFVAQISIQEDQRSDSDELSAVQRRLHPLVSPRTRAALKFRQLYSSRRTRASRCERVHRSSSQTLRWTIDDRLTRVERRSSFRRSSSFDASDYSQSQRASDRQS